MRSRRRKKRGGSLQILLAVSAAIVTVAVIVWAGSRILDGGAEQVSESVAASSEEQGFSGEVTRETMGSTLPEETTSFFVAAETAEADDEDPQMEENRGGGEGAGAQVDMEQMIAGESEETAKAQSYGIDVSKWQGKIDWQQVKQSGIDFAMVRVGYRTQKTGEICEDPYARYNLQEAQKAGVMVGAYFFSTAVTEEEAREEAAWVRDFIAKYKITYPVAYNCEGFRQEENRQYGLSKEERTNLAVVFLNYIEEMGYTPMFYAAKNELSGSTDWDTKALDGRFQIWVSQYPDIPYPDTARSSYEGTHHMWQYTSQGRVNGISKPVDVNIAYFSYEEEAQPKDPVPPKEVADTPELGIVFTEVREEVTAKDKTNLRTEPSSVSPETVVYQLQNGEFVTRTGLGSNGWSRVEYKGQTLYAVTSYLTTELEDSKEAVGPGAEAPREEPETLEEGEADPLSKVVFTEVNESVTAKIETNLRTEPSTRGDDTVVYQLTNGEIATRTGLGSNGWSRVEYNGQTLYAVTSYLMPAE